MARDVLEVDLVLSRNVIVLPLLAAGAIWLLAACGASVQGTYPEPTSPGSDVYDPTGKSAQNNNTIFGPGGLTFGGPKQKNDSGSGGAGIGVNSFLWRASLDTVAFMPLSSADPFGGIILTDWYSPPATPNERFKAQIYILDRQLRSDGVTAKVFKEVRTDRGWISAPVSPDTSSKLIDAILTRARQLRIDAEARGS